ncbi:MAG: ABC transporter permease [Lachnospiraceae bacterium]|nr:ABC transporter permease [Lachnospiraceae bacterium]
MTGSIAGALIGGKILPYIILQEYKILYPNIENLMFPYNLEHSFVASLASLVCILSATLIACTKSLMEVPASLMRPVAPKQTKKLLLERIPTLWNKIQFNWKNALRNFIRYKKRLVMTLFGICGSTALLLVGFGLKDSVDTILYAQYGKICLYNEVLTIDATASEKDKAELQDLLSKDSRFKSYLYTYQMSLDAESDNSKEILSPFIFVPEDLNSFEEHVRLANRITGEKLTLKEGEVIVSEKMASVLGVKEGDILHISSNQKDKKDVKIGGIAENYVYHYVYMTPDTYESLYKKAPEYNSITLRNNDGVTIDADEFGKEFLQYDAVGGVQSISVLIDKFSDILDSMDMITLVLIVCAGALTFVVLYNLNNINISERRRELATLKVLGFYDIELSQYIYRENILITIIGVALGLLGGVLLNSYVINTVEVDLVMFGRQIFFPSFVESVLIAVGFTAIVNIIVHFKLKKIDMATSLKSVE